MSGHIYFIRSGSSDWIKIGYAKNVKHRMCDLQVGNPEIITIVATVPGTVKQERQLHQRLLHQKQCRKRGEWFMETHAVKFTLQMVMHGHTIENVFDAIDAYRLVTELLAECATVSGIIDHARPDPAELDELRARLRELDMRFDSVLRLLSKLLGGDETNVIPIQPKHRRAA